MPDYDNYSYTVKEWILVIGKGLVFVLVPGWLFYRSLWIMLFLLPVLLLIIRLDKKEKLEQKRARLNREFADALASLSAALEAGYSFENAVTECIRDLGLIYRKEDLIIQELNLIQRQIMNNRSPEDLFSDFAARSHDEDIRMFAQIFRIAKRSGGDLLHMIRATERTITEKSEVRSEVRTVMTGKRFESNIMNLMPLGILLYFNLIDPEFLEPLYSGIFGRVVMTGFLALYVGCILLTRKITKIQV